MKKIAVFGATSAIAGAMCRLFAARGDSLFLVARHPERLESVRADLQIRGNQPAHAAVADLRDCSAHADLLRQAADAMNGLDAVVIAHGVLPDQNECDESTAATLDAIQANGVSAVSLMSHAASRFAQQGSGCVVFISSVAADRGRGSNYVYGAGKALATVYASGLRNRLFKRGVHVLTVKPGFVDTPMTSSFPKGALWAKPESVARGIVNAMDKRRDEAYLPGFWRVVMLIIRAIPERIFKRLSL